MTKPTLLLAGASSEIAQAIAHHVAAHDQWHLITLGRNALDNNPAHLQTDLTQSAAVDAVSHWLQDHNYRPSAVIACMGVLHDTPHQPEKTLSQISVDWLMQNMQVNLVSHMHLAQAMHSQISRRQSLRWISLSAKVGSIEDNQLGGWHSYRISKAALNMLIRNLAIEWQRKNPENTVVAVHPGTTDSPLSKPFQARIKPEKLFTADQSAKRILTILNNLSPNQNGQLLHWNGETLPW